MGLVSWFRRLLGRRNRDWLWTTPGSFQYLHSTEQRHQSPAPTVRVTYPEPELPSELQAGSSHPALPQTEAPVVLVAEERSFEDLPYISVVESALRRSKVILGFADGRVLLETQHPFVKDFVRAADRMMRPGRRLSWKKARLERAPL